ncbi:hypothetical protein N9A86_02700 [Akkermansiaceae bacterium]|nr:hypothetical protein [Akkermansiaceae bacterium]MDB4537589.1 hypothetical protein [Akkermansiaceae bacterium]
MKTLILFLVALSSALDARGQKNDDFADSIYLGGAYPITVNGTTDGEKNGGNATKEPNEPKHGGVLGSGSVWYRWKPVLRGRYEISVLSEKLDIILAVYTGDAFDNLTPVNRYQNLKSPTVSLKANEPFTSGARVEFDADPDQLYSIAVDGDRLTSGDFTIRVCKFKNPLDPKKIVLPANSKWQYYIAQNRSGIPVNPESLDNTFHKTWFRKSLYKGPRFQDAAQAPLGYGNLNGLGLQTYILGDKNAVLPRGQRYTAYFRTSFTPDEEIKSLGIEGVFDDGAIVYVNGVEAARFNIGANETPTAGKQWPSMRKTRNRAQPKPRSAIPGSWA